MQMCSLDRRSVQHWLALEQLGHGEQLRKNYVSVHSTPPPPAVDRARQPPQKCRRIILAHEDITPAQVPASLTQFSMSVSRLLEAQRGNLETKHIGPTRYHAWFLDDRYVGFVGLVRTRSRTRSRSASHD